MDSRAPFLPLGCGEGFLGPVAGYVFANGGYGLGYYRDRRLEADRDHICAALVEEFLAGASARVRAQAQLRAAAELDRLLQRAVTISEHAARPSPPPEEEGEAGGADPRGGGGAALPASLSASLEAEFARILGLPGGVAYLTKGSGVAVVASGRGCSEEVARRALRSALEKVVPPLEGERPPSTEAGGAEELGGRQREKDSSASPSSSAEVCESCSRLRGRRRCAGCRRLGPLANRARVVPCSAATPLFEAWLATVEEGSEGGLGNRSAPAALRPLFLLQQAALRRALREWAAFVLVYCRALRSLSRGLSAARTRGSFDSWLKWARGRRVARARLAAEAGGRVVPSWEAQAAPLDGRPRWRGAAGSAKAVEALVSARVKGAKGPKGSRGAGGGGGGVGAPGSREWFHELGKEQAFARKAFGYIQ